MLIHFPFNYVNLLAFISILKYENKRRINLETLEKYRRTLLDEVIKDYNFKKTTYFQLIDAWEGKIDFYFDPNDSINNFLSKFPDLFYIDGDAICLYDEVNYDDLINREIMIREEEGISHRFQSASNNSKVLDVLNINTIKLIIEKYVALEKQIEKEYSKLDCNDIYSSEKIKKLLSTRDGFLNITCQQADYMVDAFRIESTNFFENVTEYEYSKPPIDLELWKKGRYYKNSKNDIGDIDDIIYDIFQYAIFGSSSLARFKVNEMLENLCFGGTEKKSQSKDISDDFYDNFILDEEIDGEFIYYILDTEETDLCFYMIYLNKLNDYMKKYGETPDLIKTRNRLLYALDMPSLSLYVEENFMRQLEEAKELEFEKDDFEFIVDEVIFLAHEVFMRPQDENTIKKLLLISTYYELTKDKRIVKILTKYSNHENFSLYIEIIFGNQPGNFKRLLRI